MSHRHFNGGVRKVCGCARRGWAKCPHPWHFNFKWRATSYRFSVDAQVGRHIESKTEAERLAEGFRVAIREGTFQRLKRGRELGEDPRPVRERMTLTQLLKLFAKARVTGDSTSAVNRRWEIAAIERVPLELPTGETRAFGAWLVVDITTATLHQFRAYREQVRLVPSEEPDRAPRRVGGQVTANRNLALLSVAFNWAIDQGHLEHTPFRRGDRPAIRLTREVPRNRRLEAGEIDKLLTACKPHLRAVVEAALETGCRKGELLTLQWHQVRWTPRAELVLPAPKTKTRTARTIPISSRLKAILEMRRLDPAGDEHGPDAYVFGNEIGQRVKGLKTAWETACRSAGLSDLHFHDLRREAGSRWLEGGVPLHTVKTWLGHANITQTSTYLASTFLAQHDAMQAFETRRADEANQAKGKPRRGAKGRGSKGKGETTPADQVN